MLDYTIAAGKQVWKNIKLLSRIVNIVMQAISILFLLYITIFGDSILPITLALLTLSVAYLVFYCVTLANSKKKTLKKVVKTIFKWSKRAIKLINLVIMVYTIASADQQHALDMLLTVFSVIFWVLDILLEVACIIVKSWGLLLYEGLKTDFEKIAAPVTGTKNFFKKLTGQEVEEKPEPTKRRIFLDGLVEAAKKEKAEKKQADKQLKKQQKQTKKEEKKAEKLAKKQSKRDPAPTVEDEAAVTDDL